METKPKKSEVAKQIKNAFEFVQKLYNEASYLVKEIEGQLGETEYKFTILKPSGYSVSTRSSTGLEPNNVNWWLMRRFSVAFADESFTELKKGQNFTEITDNLKVLYFKIILDDKQEKEPQLLFGVFYDIKQFKDWVKKFENLMGTFEYADSKIFAKFPDLDYVDGTFQLKGEFKKVNLLEINSSSDLIEKVISPVIKLYERAEEKQIR